VDPVIREASAEDRPWITATLRDQWYEPRVVSRGKVHQADHLPAIIAEHEGERVGLATYHVDGPQCELVTLDALRRGLGIGTRLIDAVAARARALGCRRMWLITTNDNLEALRFYQKRGLVLAALYPRALERSRELKPSIPLTGYDDIPIRDELELELILSGETP
jgi:GNAT superfamily N-acetyltransferase